MRKIPTMFVRPNGSKLVTDEVFLGCEWVLAGEGIASRKWDGICCMIRGGVFYKRLEWDEQNGPAPASWLHSERGSSVRHGHGWIPVGDGAEDWMHRDGWARWQAAGVGGVATDGTYELLGPRIGKNPEGVRCNLLVPHGNVVIDLPVRSFGYLRDYLAEHEIEGIVFKHEDGRMAKIKRRDFGIPWPIKRAVVAHDSS